ncbi:TetR/AcrR family transcriptional regulator [Nocardiopsis sp. EMB25]|uniref:TetR/AcrR family transcriptional regulator n=1 Tax=Nocardiopsis TaxID=2013 RepID=UPI00034A8CEB|nr:MULTISPECIES: TetR/AcrR family transcriptional regulator [Nocardiopsis]MCY9783076.1 TetR/AcrR family transcriptional regulator [Nocardiopsis sp. EMB25]
MTVTATKPLTPAARRILAVASELFYSRGINTVGMELVAERASVTKKTIYDRFGSKRELVVAYLRARDERWRAYLTDYLTGAHTPHARVIATFDALHSWMGRENPRGCAMVNAYTELADPEHPGRAVAEGQKRWLRDLLTGFVAQAGADDPAALAESLAMLHEGAVVARSVLGETNAALTARAAAETLMSAHGIAGDVPRQNGQR